MKHFRFYVIFLTSLCSFAQSPWTLDKNAFYTQINYTNISNYSILFGSPEYETERQITDNTIQLYGEYGVSKKTTLLLSVPVKFIKAGDLTNLFNVLPSTASNNKMVLGNISVGAKHQLINKKWVMSLQLTIEAKTSTFEIRSGIRSGYGAWSFTPTINIGRGFKKYYVQIFSGIDLKTHHYSSNIKLGGEIGLKAQKHIWLILYIDAVQSLKNGDIFLPLNNQLTGLYVNNQSYGGYGLKAIGEISKKIGVTTSFGGAFYGDNVAKKVALNFGLFYKF